jgi:imidazolonepropionase-like amidohydrolase
MKRLALTLLACVTLGALTPLFAQDVTITNARIVVANGTVIERGSIVVRGGKIVSVAAGAPSAAAGQTIDAKGMTAMPGFIDAHRHINTGPNEKAQMQAQLEAGYTTILSGGGPGEGNITLRDHIEKGVNGGPPINGPRIIPSQRVALNNNTPENARAEIRKMAEMGIKFTGEIALTPVPGPSERELEVLRAIVDEAKKVGVMVQVHAVSSKAMVAAVEAGVRLLVHLPNKDWVSKEDAKKVADSGTKILGTVGFGTPVFGVFADDNNARFRDGRPWPASIVDGVRLGEEAGYMPVNARTIWDAGAILGYCTDTTYDPLAGLDHELRAINAMFSMKDIIKMMGPNTASYIQMGDQLGTLEPGKLADIILLDGNPLEGYWNMLKTKVVVKGGMVVVDKR